MQGHEAGERELGPSAAPGDGVEAQVVGARVAAQLAARLAASTLVIMRRVGP